VELCKNKGKKAHKRLPKTLFGWCVRYISKGICFLEPNGGKSDDDEKSATTTTRKQITRILRKRKWEKKFIELIVLFLSGQKFCFNQMIYKLQKQLWNLLLY